MESHLIWYERYLLSEVYVITVWYIQQLKLLAHFSMISSYYMEWHQMWYEMLFMKQCTESVLIWIPQQVELLTLKFSIE